MINRRRVLWGGMAAVGITVLGAWGIGRVGFEAGIASALRRRLAYLTLDEAGLKHFAKDQADATFNKKFPTWNRLRYHLSSTVAPSFQRFYRMNDSRSQLTRLEDTLVVTYLLSSDFFLNGAQETRTINYLAYFDPQRPCQNPFSRAVGGI